MSMGSISDPVFVVGYPGEPLSRPTYPLPIHMTAGESLQTERHDNDRKPVGVFTL